MENISLKVSELYELKALILGLDIINTQDQSKKTLVNGFVNELSLPEGVKRAAYRIGKAAEVETSQIDEQRKRLYAGSDAESAAAREKELFCDVLELAVEKIPFSRIEHLTLPNNYQFLYDKIFS